MSDVLIAEYEQLIAELGPHTTDDQIIGALTANAAWTKKGAETLLMLAQEYGTAVLRNALALAAAMEIEDGESGM